MAKYTYKGRTREVEVTSGDGIQGMTHPADEYIMGIPAADLSEEDYAELSEEAKAAVASSPMYEEVTERKKPGKKGEATDPVVTGETDADQVTAGVSPNLDTPPTLPQTVTPVAAVGEPEQTGAIQSDHR